MLVPCPPLDKRGVFFVILHVEADAHVSQQQDTAMRYQLFRYQHTPSLEKGPSLHAYSAARPLEPAKGEGWRGYWWAQGIFTTPHPVTGELREMASEELYLIRSSDVKRARRGEEVDLFVPGIYGCLDPYALHDYVERCVGGADDDAYVVVYEGIILDEYHVLDEYADVFQPIRVVRVYNARRWMEYDEGWEEEE
jgi:hypothetical protein